MEMGSWRDEEVLVRSPDGGAATRRLPLLGDATARLFPMSRDQAVTTHLERHHQEEPSSLAVICPDTNIEAYQRDPHIIASSDTCAFLRFVDPHLSVILAMGVA
jgi:hypothetical protein